MQKRHFAFLFILTLAATQVSAQFEQKLSLNLSGGVFKTLGYSDFLPDDAAHNEAYEPALMANFKTGYSLTAALQYNLNRHLSIEVSFGRSASDRWYFDPTEDGDESHNYLYYEILSDPVNYIVQESGENELYLSSLQFGVAPRYYFMPGKKFNPYLSAGIHVAYIDVHFKNFEFERLEALGRVAEYEPNPIEQWHGYSTNMGFNAGIGTEYNLGDNLGLFLQARYHFTLLGEYDFSDQASYLDYHSLELHLGVRVSFLKSKDL